MSEQTRLPPEVAALCAPAFCPELELPSDDAQARGWGLVTPGHYQRIDPQSGIATAEVRLVGYRQYRARLLHPVQREARVVVAVLGGAIVRLEWIEESEGVFSAEWSGYQGAVRRPGWYHDVVDMLDRWCAVLGDCPATVLRVPSIAGHALAFMGIVRGEIMTSRDGSCRIFDGDGGPAEAMAAVEERVRARRPSKGSAQ